MFVVWPLAHIGADFRQNRLGDGGADAVDGHQVHASDTEDVRAGVASRGFLLWECGLRGGVGDSGQGRFGGGFEARFNDGEGVFDLGVACAELGGGEIEQRQGLLEDKEMLLTPGAGQRQGDLIYILLAAGIPQGREGARVALARDNGAEDTLPSGTRHIAERLRSLPMHLQEGFLHMEDVGGPRLNKLGTMA